MEEIITRKRIMLFIEKKKKDGMIEISIRMKNSKNCILHWGLCRNQENKWHIPQQSLWPDNSKAYGQAAVQTHLTRGSGENKIVITMNQDTEFSDIVFAVFFPDENQWDNNNGQNYHINIQYLQKESFDLAEVTKEEINLPDLPELSTIVQEIVMAETRHNSWTLMHRFNLCYDLLEGVKNNINGLALIYVWLRFSAIRQLDWQRNYNTKPKELSHSQDRLTLKLAILYVDSGAESKGLIRLILATLGRGGEGQRIRDDILHIMHKHHIKEVSGRFMEEWHQKLHNNATPDDIAICHAYLEFLRSNGDLDRFYKTLEDNGVTKKRLEGFERPIVTPPDFVPHLKNGLIYDFENYLKLLKSIHSGTDLETAVNTVRNLLDKDMINLLNNILYRRDADKQSAVNLSAMITEARGRLVSFLNADRDNYHARSFLYLDLALEEFLRIVIERNIHLRFDGDQLVELIGLTVKNMRFSHNNEEGLEDCSNHWEMLKELPHFDHDWSLHARSILDRLERSTGAFIDRYYRLFQPKAELLGNAFKADSWTITLFSEEIVRGRPAFALSQLIRQLDPILRKAANLGNWQIISRGDGMGRLEIVNNLRTIQMKKYYNPTVIVADKVTGDEEIPENVKAVITSDVTDIVSHIAVRARNSRILFATCYDTNIISRLKSLNNSLVNLTINSSGDVIFEEYTDKPYIKPSDQTPTVSRYLPITTPLDFIGYAISEKDFREGVVGNKSLNLARLKKKLPDWIQLPNSAAIPFGVFEKILNSEINREIAEQYNALANKLDEDNKPEDTLAELRKTIFRLEVEEGLLLSLQDALKYAMIALPEDWNKAWECINRVWASKWNERAYISRKTNQIPDESLFMAVLIQEVINADYAFVIHTANPFSNDKAAQRQGELYAEVAPGLGETLVSNYPGRALSFTARKASPEPKLLSFPSKSVGLFGKGVIFRSDSNGEDLAGYAGAGLYDSVMLEPPSEVKLNYTNEPLILDERFRNKLMAKIIKIAIEVENAFDGVPQDIEGVFAGGRYYVVQTRVQAGV